MIDLETTGSNPGCCILSIGAVGISNAGEKVFFYSRISHKLSKEAFFVDDEKNMEWWKTVDEETKKEAFGGNDECSPKKIINEFIEFVQKNFDPKAKDFSVWSKGSDFDFPILKAYIDGYGFAMPWPYYRQRDYRTLQALFPFVALEEKNEGKHNALEDARGQMRGLEFFASLEAIFKEKPKRGKAIAS